MTEVLRLQLSKDPINFKPGSEVLLKLTGSDVLALMVSSVLGRLVFIVPERAAPISV